MSIALEYLDNKLLNNPEEMTIKEILIYSDIHGKQLQLAEFQSKLQLLNGVISADLFKRLTEELMHLAQNYEYQETFVIPSDKLEKTVSFGPANIKTPINTSNMTLVEALETQIAAGGELNPVDQRVYKILTNSLNEPKKETDFDMIMKIEIGGNK